MNIVVGFIYLNYYVLKFKTFNKINFNRGLLYYYYMEINKIKIDKKKKRGIK